MKGIVKYLALIMVTIFLLAGCGKQPTEEINAAKASVDAVMTEGAQKFAAEDAKKLNDSLQAAQDELKVQDGKTFKDFAKAKELLAKAKADADALKAGLPAKKEEAKKNALAALEAAQAAATEAKALLAKAPKGKGSRADIEALKGDLEGMDDALAAAKKASDAEDYSGAIAGANTIKDKAAAVADQLKKAMAKVGKK